MAVSFLRTYNSANQEDGPLGKGWTHSYNAAIINQTADSVTVRNPDGRLNLFARQVNGSYTAPPGVYDTLTQKC